MPRNVQSEWPHAPNDDNINMPNISDPDWNADMAKLPFPPTGRTRAASVPTLGSIEHQEDRRVSLPDEHMLANFHGPLLEIRPTTPRQRALVLYGACRRNMISVYTWLLHAVTAFHSLITSPAVGMWLAQVQRGQQECFNQAREMLLVACHVALLTLRLLFHIFSSLFLPWTMALVQWIVLVWLAVYVVRGCVDQTRFAPLLTPADGLICFNQYVVAIDNTFGYGICLSQPPQPERSPSTQLIPAITAEEVSKHLTSLADPGSLFETVALAEQVEEKAIELRATRDEFLSVRAKWRYQHPRPIGLDEAVAALGKVIEIASVHANELTGYSIDVSGLYFLLHMAVNHLVARLAESKDSKMTDSLRLRYTSFSRLVNDKLKELIEQVDVLMTTSKEEIQQVDKLQKILHNIEVEADRIWEVDRNASMRAFEAKWFFQRMRSEPHLPARPAEYEDTAAIKENCITHLGQLQLSRDMLTDQLRMWGDFTSFMLKGQITDQDPEISRQIYIEALRSIERKLGMWESKACTIEVRREARLAGKWAKPAEADLEKCYLNARQLSEKRTQ